MGRLLREWNNDQSLEQQVRVYVAREDHAIMIFEVSTQDSNVNPKVLNY